MSDLLVKFIHFYIFSILVNSHKKAISVRVEILYRYSARVGIHLNSPNTDFWNSNKWDFSTESCFHWNPLKPVFHNLTAISNLLWAPYSKDGSRRHNMAWSLISKGHFIMGLKNTNGKVFCANYTMQRALNENILIKNVNNALWRRKKKKKKKVYLHRASHTSYNFWDCLSFITLPNYEESQPLCDGRSHFIFKTARWLHRKDRHNKMSFADILFLHIVLFYPR